jgi:hypothetical protein
VTGQGIFPVPLHIVHFTVLASVSFSIRLPAQVFGHVLQAIGMEMYTIAKALNHFSETRNRFVSAIPTHARYRVLVPLPFIASTFQTSSGFDDLLFEFFICHGCSF